MGLFSKRNKTLRVRDAPSENRELDPKLQDFIRGVDIETNASSGVVL